MIESQRIDLTLKDVAALTPEQLHARYARRIASHVRSLLGSDDEREDLVQEILMAVFGGIKRLRDPACLDGWVFRVTANKVKGLLRHRSVRQHASLEALPEPEMPSCHADLDASLLVSRAARVIERLPPQDRALLVALWFSPATLDSIAATSGCAPITVRRRLSRARTRFERLARLDPALAGLS
jgi:RNA polymerase sigma-70 factor (ECF subfamily)